MKKVFSIIFAMSLFISCTNDISNTYLENDSEYNELANIIKGNKEYFLNQINKPSIYYTFIFTSSYQDFVTKDLEKNEHLPEDEYNKLGVLFQKLSISELYLLDSNNFMFKVTKDDFILRENLYYLGYLEDMHSFIGHNNFDGLYFQESNEISENWYSLSYMSSPAD